MKDGVWEEQNEMQDSTDILAVSVYVAPEKVRTPPAWSLNRRSVSVVDHRSLIFDTNV
jgi:hypothetical protein